MLYQPRLGPKKLNLVMAWAGPYLVDWVYTNGTFKLKNLSGLRLPGYYNISKIKKYECLVRQSGIEKGKESSESEADLNQLVVEEDDSKQPFRKKKRKLRMKPGKKRLETKQRKLMMKQKLKRRMKKLKRKKRLGEVTLESR